MPDSRQSDGNQEENSLGEQVWDVQEAAGENENVQDGGVIDGEIYTGNSRWRMRFDPVRVTLAIGFIAVVANDVARNQINVTEYAAVVGAYLLGKSARRDE